MQGVIKSYDPGTRVGIIVRDTDLAEVDLAPDALAGTVFRLLRPGQRVIFDLDGEGQATRLRLGSEVDMGTPGFDPELGPVEGTEDPERIKRTGGPAAHESQVTTDRS